MTVEDLAANRQVRHVFARNWVNTQKLNFGATHGIVYIRGRMTLLREPPSAPGEERDRSGVSAKFLMYIEKELMKISEVKGVRWQLDGWQRTSSAWLSHGIH